METQQSNSPDIFESILNLEETHHKQGYKEGFTHGVAAGNRQDGKEVGLKTGFEVGEELGFYRGCIDIWSSVVQLDPTRFSTGVQRKIKVTDQLIERYPVMDPENEIVGEIMDELRLKFRMLRSSLGRMIRASLGLGDELEYDGYPKPIDTEFRNCD